MSGARAGKQVLVGICAALLLVAATPGHSQPTSHTSKWLEAESEADAAKDIDKHVLPPSDSGSGSLLNTILDWLGLGGSPDSAAQGPVNPGGTAERHVERVDDRRAADKSLRVVGPGTSKGDGGPRAALPGESPEPTPLVAWRQQLADEKLASQTHGPWSWVPQFWRDMWQTELPEEDSPEASLSALDIYAIIVLAVIAVLAVLLRRRRRAYTHAVSAPRIRERPEPGLSPRRQHSRRAT